MNNHFNTIALFLAIAALFAAGCENTFDPKADFQEELVVYSVLSNTNERQTVRLESTYDAEFTNPDNPLDQRVITEADVYISDGRSEYKFIREKASEPDSPVPYVWASTALIPVEGRSYALRVVIDGETVAKANMQVPSRPFLEMYMVDASESGASGLRVGIGRISTFATPKGYYFRLYILGKSGDGTVVGREIPYAFNSSAGENGEYVYPSPGRETAVVWSTSYIQRWKEALERDFQATDLTLLGVGYSLETHFYNYYKVVRGFDDPVSVRQDKPNITNISGGLGVFGGMAVDSLYQSYNSLIR